MVGSHSVLFMQEDTVVEDVVVKPNKATSSETNKLAIWL